MLLGLDDETQCQHASDKRQKELDMMIPHQIFAWLPHQVDNGQYAWLQKIWRFAHGFDYSILLFKYARTQEVALKESKRLNGWLSNDYMFGAEVRKRLGP